MKITAFWSLIVVLLFSANSCNLSVAGEPDLSANSDFGKSVVDYDWGNVRIGGGGYVTGMVIHGREKDVRYIRTDVGGAYRWEPTASRWVPMLDNVRTGEQVDGIAFDLNNPDRVYVALNDGVYRSEDRGHSWNKIFEMRYSGNANLRWTGECLAIDPLNSDVIYAGTRFNGLWRSFDGGARWSQAKEISEGNVRMVAVDSGTGTQGRSSNIYIGLPGKGIYFSCDGGETFNIMPGAPASPNRMQVVSGSLYVTHTKGISKYSEGAFHDITPKDGVDKNYCGIAVDTHNPLKIVAAQRYSSSNIPMFCSSDGGSSWTLLNSSERLERIAEVPWWPKNWFSSATSCIAFDPFKPGSVYFTDWFGIWFTDDIWSPNTIRFTTLERGHEETVVLTLASPPKGPFLYSGVCDVFGFSHEDIDQFPSKRLYSINEGFSISFCEKHPENIAILGGKGNDGAITVLATSSNYGKEWTNRNLPGGTRLGKIAISAENPDKMVYAAGTKTGAVYYTTDRGNTWSAANGSPVGACGLGTSDVWNKDFVLAPDGANGDVFYIFKDGHLFASKDGGANWEKRNPEAIPARGNYMFVQPAPGFEGHVWISLHSNGLYKSTDGGRTFRKADGFNSSIAFSWGAPAPGSSYPAAYCYGNRDGIEGMYRSIDMGKSWQQMSTTWNDFPANVKSIAGDRQTFGRVFVGTGGRGIFYGIPSKFE